MTDERIAEIERVADSLERDEYEGDDEVLAIKCMRELAALLRAAEGDEPERKPHSCWQPHPAASATSMPHFEYVSAEYADWQRAGRLLALAEIEQLKAQLVGAQKRDDINDKWKLVAEYQYAKRAYPDDLALGHGALNASLERLSDEYAEIVNTWYDTARAK